MDDSLRLLTTAHRDLAGVLGTLSPEEAWEPTGCAGWSVLDLGFHLLSDARRALVAFNTPAAGPADTDAVAYWRAWRPPEPGDEVELWSTRIAASVHGGLPGISGRYAETSAAALVAASRVGPGDPPRSALLQGPAPSVRGAGGRRVLLLVLRLDRPGPAAGPLAEVRRVLEGLHGGPLPGGWDDATAARRGTGREPLTTGDRAELGSSADAFPLFG